MGLSKAAHAAGYMEMLKNDKNISAQSKIENLKELLIAMQDYSSIEEFLEHVSLVTAIDEKNEDKYGLGNTLSNIGIMYHDKGDSKKALEYSIRALELREDIGDKQGIGISLHNIGVIYYEIDDYKIAEQYLVKSLAIQNEIGVGKDNLLETTTYLYLTYKKLGKKYNIEEINLLIKEAEFIEYYLYFAIYQLTQNLSYLSTAYTLSQELANNLEPNVKAKFLSYLIPKAIVEEWEKIK